MLVVLLFSLSACQNKQVDITIVGPVENVSYIMDVAPIIASSCGGSSCHIGQETSGVDLSSFAQIRNSVGSQYSGPIVIPGSAPTSSIVDKLGPNPQFGARMPLSRAPLNASDIAQIRSWIDDGALNN